MALYFTFYLECYREEDAERLRSWETPFQIAGRSVTHTRGGIEPQNGFKHMDINDQSPGYFCYGYGAGMNESGAATESLYPLIVLTSVNSREPLWYDT